MNYLKKISISIFIFLIGMSTTFASWEVTGSEINESNGAFLTPLTALLVTCDDSVGSEGSYLMPTLSINFTSELDLLCGENIEEEEQEDAQIILLNGMDSVASGGLDVLGALMGSTFGQILIFVFGVLLLILVVGSIFFVYKLVSRKG